MKLRPLRSYQVYFKMKKLLCILFGHHWIFTVDGTEYYCLRCSEVRQVHREPVSTLDSIVNDKGWYKPLRKRTEQRKDE